MELTDQEKKILEQVYGKFVSEVGYSTNQIEEIQELSKEESNFFSKKNFVSPHFCIQTLYKIKGEVSPLKFNRAVRSLISEDKNFRANFFNIGMRTLKIIFSENYNVPEVTFRVLKLEGEELDETLIKIMEADRRVKFNLQRGSLIRFSVFRTGENEAAILITVSQLIAPRFNSESFFEAVFYNGDYEKIEPRAEFKVPQIENRVKEYWTDILKNLPAPPKVPFSKNFSGAYNEEIYRTKIPADILSDLRLKTQSSRIMLLAALQTAWGFLLQSSNKSSDVAFCQLTSRRQSEQKFALNLMPVRLKVSNAMTIENIVNQQFKQLVVSQPYSFFDWLSIENLTAYKTKMLDHFLSFLDFNAEEKTFSQIAATPEGKIVERNSWDAQGMKLGIYFQYTSKTLSITIQYDKNQFSPNAGELLTNIYNLILRQMLVYWNAPFANFIKNIEKITAEIAAASEQQHEDERKIINDFIYKNTLLQSEATGTNAILVENSKLITCFEGDRISGDILYKNLVFVVEGKLARSLDTGDGWFNALDIIKAGGLLNETVFLDKRRTTISAEVLTEKALLLLIPLDTFESATRQTPALYKSVLQHIANQMEKYQLLWLQS